MKQKPNNRHSTKMHYLFDKLNITISMHSVPPTDHQSPAVLAAAAGFHIHIRQVVEKSAAGLGVEVLVAVEVGHIREECILVLAVPVPAVVDHIARTVVGLEEERWVGVRSYLERSGFELEVER